MTASAILVLKGVVYAIAPVDGSYAHSNINWLKLRPRSIDQLMDPSLGGLSGESGLGHSRLSADGGSEGLPATIETGAMTSF